MDEKMSRIKEARVAVFNPETDVMRVLIQFSFQPSPELALKIHEEGARLAQVPEEERERTYSDLTAMLLESFGLTAENVAIPSHVNVVTHSKEDPADGVDEQMCRETFEQLREKFDPLSDLLGGLLMSMVRRREARAEDGGDGESQAAEVEGGEPPAAKEE